MILPSMLYIHFLVGLMHTHYLSNLSDYDLANTSYLSRNISFNEYILTGRLEKIAYLAQDYQPLFHTLKLYLLFLFISIWIVFCVINYYKQEI